MTPKIYYMEWLQSWLILPYFSIEIVTLRFDEKNLPIKMTPKIYYMKWLQSWLLLPYFGIEIVTLRFDEKKPSHKNDPQNLLHEMVTILTPFNLL